MLPCWWYWSLLLLPFTSYWWWCHCWWWCVCPLLMVKWYYWEIQYWSITAFRWHYYVMIPWYSEKVKWRSEGIVIFNGWLMWGEMSCVMQLLFIVCYSDIRCLFVKWWYLDGGKPMILLYLLHYYICLLFDAVWYCVYYCYTRSIDMYSYY